jgi:hypothetical protein
MKNSVVAFGKFNSRCQCFNVNTSRAFESYLDILIPLQSHASQMHEYHAMKSSEMYQGCPNFQKIGATYAISEATSNTSIAWHRCLGTSFVRKDFCILKPYALIDTVFLKKLTVAQLLNR